MNISKKKRKPMDEIEEINSEYYISIDELTGKVDIKKLLDKVVLSDIFSHHEKILKEIIEGMVQ